MALTTTGKILTILDKKQNGNFAVRKFVIETTGKYPQKVPFELYNDKIDLLKNFNKGDTVEVSFNLRGREWKGDYFSSLNAWKIAQFQSEVTTSQHQTQRNLETEDLPF